MVSQKNLSHSSLMRDVAPLRCLVLLFLPAPPGPALVVVAERCLLDDLWVRASSLSDVMAARGGLVGGDGSPEEGTSGIPLCPSHARGAVVEAPERGRGVDEVAAGKDIRLAGGGVLAVITTTVIGFLFHWRHCFCWVMPLWGVSFVVGGRGRGSAGIGF